jgi:hypothetical protein
MILVSGGHESSAWQVFLSVALTVVVFWAAHVFAGTLARHGGFGLEQRSLGQAFVASVRRSIGFLDAAVPPSIVLLLGALGVLNDDLAIWTALWLGVIILAILGYLVFRNRGDSWPLRIAGALGTAAFGAVMIVLKALIH